MDRRSVLLATLALPAMLASFSTFAQTRPPGAYRGGEPPAHMPPGDLPPQLQKGDRVGPEFRNRQFVVDDWRQHGLEPPPRGRHWVGLAGRYYLVRSSNWTVERVGP
ncbi:RcnB family protein [Paraburkholderia adhaesiva]|uniref:RcnB family protein n=1 Tax=Paraburkholderia adhaesiva TaxID=2883244 RepID=UPI001F1FBFA9|nr:RcnB family protein [Paraburkholderia adhaesiva]